MTKGSLPFHTFFYVPFNWDHFEIWSLFEEERKTCFFKKLFFIFSSCVHVLWIVLGCWQLEMPSVSIKGNSKNLPLTNCSVIDLLSSHSVSINQSFWSGFLFVCWFSSVQSLLVRLIAYLDGINSIRVDYRFRSATLSIGFRIELDSRDWIFSPWKEVVALVLLLLLLHFLLLLLLLFQCFFISSQFPKALPTNGMLTFVMVFVRSGVYTNHSSSSTKIIIIISFSFFFLRISKLPAGSSSSNAARPRPPPPHRHLHPIRPAPKELRGITGFSTEFYGVWLGFTGFYWVLLGFVGFYWVLRGFTEFY